MANYLPKFIRNLSPARFLVSVSLAAIVWGYVTVTQYPERTSPPYEVPLLPPSPPNGLIWVPLPEQQPDTVRIRVSGPATLVETITSGQLRPFVDLSEITTAGNHTAEIRLRPGLLPEGVRAEIDKKNIPVRLENRISKTLKLEVIRQGEVNPDYTLEGEILPSPSQVTVEGAASLVNRIARAQVTVNVNNRVGVLNATPQVQLLDAAGEQLSTSNLSVVPSTVSVTANINYKLSTRTVPIRVVTRGEPASGFIAGNAEASPVLATITSGNDKLLNQIDSIATEPVDISGASSQITRTIELQAPADVTIQGNRQVQVKIGIVPFQTSKTLAVQVEVLNQAVNLSYYYFPTTVNLTISGPFQAFQPDLPLDKIRAYIDLQGYTLGNHEVPVKTDLPSRELVVTNKPIINVTVSRPLPTPTPVPTRTPTPVPTPTSTPLPSPTAGPTLQSVPLTPRPLTPGSTVAAAPPADAILTTPGPATTSTPALTTAAATATALPIQPQPISSPRPQLTPPVTGAARLQAGYYLLLILLSEAYNPGE